MSTQRIYALPVEVTQWKFDGATDLQFNWEYDDGSSALLELYEKGKALNAGSLFQVDEVIDPAETRRWLIAGLRSLPPSPVREGKRRPCVDGW